MTEKQEDELALKVLTKMREENYEQWVKVCVDERVAQRMMIDKDSQVKKGATEQLYKSQTLKKGLSNVLDIIDDEIKQLTEKDD